MFTNEHQFTSYEVISMSNGLSDHEAQLYCDGFAQASPYDRPLGAL
jgi:hypothetical protein